MDEKVLYFFNEHAGALPLYEELEGRLLSELENVTVKVQATQISFYNRHMFACVSFAKVRKKLERPDTYIVVTFGLDREIKSPRIDAASSPYPNRWTHHVLISKPSEIDGELMGWLRLASDFSDSKR